MVVAIISRCPHPLFLFYFSLRVQWVLEVLELRQASKTNALGNVGFIRGDGAKILAQRVHFHSTAHKKPAYELEL